METDKISGSKTEQNLIEALKGESLARNKYTLFASQAKKDGFVQIGKVFQEIADNEGEHSKVWFKFLHGSKMPSTKENLLDCIENEHYEHTLMYPEFARVAKEEGFLEIAKLFEQVAKIEVHHEEHYRKLLDNLEKGEVFSKPTKQKWECSKCGYTAQCKQAPEICPVCEHPKAYFFIEGEN